MHDHTTRPRGMSQTFPAASCVRRWVLSRPSPAQSLRPRLLAAVVLATVCYATPASAHKLFVFATVREKVIEGEVYFHGGDPAGNVTVTVVNPDGKTLGQTSADEEGKFTFEPRLRCDHKLVADAGLGHQAEYTVEADELPLDLPSDSPSDSPREGEPKSPATSSHHHHHHHDVPTGSHGGDDLSADIGALTQQIVALRKDVDQWNARLRVQDIVAGIGYIVGIMGLVYYFLGVRRKGKEAAEGTQSNAD